MKTIYILAAVVLIVIGVSFFLARLDINPNDQTPALPTPQSDAPQNILSQETDNKSAVFSLKLKDFSGKAVSFSNFKGRSLVINSWAAWCPFCRKELVDFAAAQKEFGDKVTIIAVDRAESKETAKKYTDGLGVTNDLLFLLDPADSFYKSIGGFSMPETIFIDKDGNVKIHKRGPMELDEIRQKIAEILD